MAKSSVKNECQNVCENESPNNTEWPLLGVPLRVSTGCHEIDAVLGGAFKVGTVTKVCGESGIGKTHLCMQSIITDHYIMTRRGIPSMSIRITARCDFPATRLYNICRKYYPEGNNTAMEEVHVLSANYGCQLTDVLTNIKTLMEVQLATPKKTRVIVTDSISALFSYSMRSVAELEEHTNMVTSIGYGLKRMAEQYRVAILVCNRVVNSFGQVNHMNFKTSGRTVKPAVGKAWDKKLEARVILNWEMDQTGTVWQRSIYQSKGDAADSRKCIFEINSSGIRAYSALNNQ